MKYSLEKDSESSRSFVGVGDLNCEVNEEEGIEREGRFGSGDGSLC